MNKAVPLQIVSTENADRFQVTFNLEIIKILREIFEQRSFIRAFFPDKTHSFLTSLVAIDEEKNHLAFDIPMQADIHHDLKEVGQLTMSTSVNNVQVQFAVSVLFQDQLNGLPAFFTTIPDNIIRLQRREFHRLVSSVATPIVCEVPKGFEVYAKFNVYDISVGGAAILDIPVDKAGTVIKGVRFHLPEEGLVIVDLVIRNVFDVTLRSGAVVRRVGCAFLHLSQITRTKIQRYILRTERERRIRQQQVNG